ncbi:hypothetical protein B0T18DRAFT_419844 [Schizothecium vesticola]|uniref:Uncharacterized protein n=1 Tax=Schizothecium vesticola TaxID=314040 RepID=A0AA40K0N5_9PEZI|nr:hypothetical protein B0T18DRAFT_419844 [Schizothecium vesticola]
MKQTMSTTAAAVAVAGAFVCVMRLLQTRRHEISRDPGEHNAGHADFRMKRSDCLLLLPGKVSPYLRIRMGGKGFACWVNQLVSKASHSGRAQFRRTHLGIRPEQKKKKRQMKSSLHCTAAHPHQNVLPKKGAAEKGQDLPPRPARRGRVSPRRRQSARLGARDDVRVSATDTLSFSKKGWHLSILPGPDRRRQKTSRRLPAKGPGALVLVNSPRDGCTGDPSCTCRTALPGDVWGVVVCWLG